MPVNRSDQIRGQIWRRPQQRPRERPELLPVAEAGLVEALRAGEGERGSGLVGDAMSAHSLTAVIAMRGRCFRT
jgi:hypothetical protein